MVEFLVQDLLHREERSMAEKPVLKARAVVWSTGVVDGSGWSVTYRGERLHCRNRSESNDLAADDVVRTKRLLPRE